MCNKDSEHPLEKFIAPNPDGFKADPFGYSSLAWQKWGLAQTLAGFPIDVSKPPTTTDLKSPVLWFTQAHALSQAAVNVLGEEPDLSNLTIYTRGVCHSQYHAVALMLVGLSLETILKAMLIVTEGVEEFTRKEKKRRHHRLHELCAFVPGLSAKDKAILECLTHFIYWAGKYPDPGSGREDDAVSVFEISEENEISAGQVFDLASRVMAHAEKVAEETGAG